MEEIATCVCRWNSWQIYRDRIECDMCGKEYRWPLECTDREATKAQDIIHLVNDNF